MKRHEPRLDIPKTSLITRFLARILPLRKSIIHSNLDIVFDNELSTKQKHQFITAFYQHVYKILSDIVRLAFFKKQPIVDIRLSPEVQKLLQENIGIILLSGHFGNWELALTQGLAKHPIISRKLGIIRRDKLKPYWLNRLIFWVYAQ